MKATYKKYKKALQGNNRFHLRRSKKLQKMVNQKTPFSPEDIKELIKYLDNDQKEDRQYFAIDFIELYQDKIPMELYEPILNAGIRHRDPSYNEHFFSVAKRMKKKKAFFADLLVRVKDGSNYERIMTINSFYWNFSFYWAYTGESDESFEEHVKPYFPKYKKQVHQLMPILTNLFLTCNNLVLQYTLSKYLPRNINRYPDELREQGKKILEEIERLGLPKTTRATREEFNRIWRAAIKDEELGKLFFDELGYRKRGTSPDMED